MIEIYKNRDYTPILFEDPIMSGALKIQLHITSCYDENNECPESSHLIVSKKDYFDIKKLFICRISKFMNSKRTKFDPPMFYSRGIIVNTSEEIQLIIVRDKRDNCIKFLISNSFFGVKLYDEIAKGKFKNIPIIFHAYGELDRMFCKGINPSLDDYDCDNMDALSREFIHDYKNSLLVEPVDPCIPYGSNPYVVTSLMYDMCKFE